MEETGRWRSTSSSRPGSGCYSSEMAKGPTRPENRTNRKRRALLDLLRSGGIAEPPLEIGDSLSNGVSPPRTCALLVIAHIHSTQLGFGLGVRRGGRRYRFHLSRATSARIPRATEQVDVGSHTGRSSYLVLFQSCCWNDGRSNAQDGAREGCKS